MKKKKKLSFKIICFLILVTILSSFLYFSSNKILEQLAVKSFESNITYVSYHAVDEILENQYDYESLLKIINYPSGEINMIITDSFKVNKLASELANMTYEKLSLQTDKGVEVPIGAFTGIKLISGFGSKVKMKLISVSSVKCEIVSSMSQAGINQTRHTLYVNILCTVNLITKTSAKTVSDKINVLVYDNLIIGKVPEVYVDTKVLGSVDKK